MSREVRIDDKVVRRPKSFCDKDCKNARPMSGTVVYIHPAGRFHTVRFDFGKNSVKECFMGVGMHE